MGRIVQITTTVATCFEFVLATLLLAIFASAYPDRYRSILWFEGGSKGWNSDPSYRTYLWANYKEVPTMPLIWDERSTQYSLCVAVITVILWLTRLFIRGPTLDTYGSVMSNALYDAILVALWSYSTFIQSSGDFSDPEHIAIRPWYLERECSEASRSSRAACYAAKGSFGLALFSILWFGLRCAVTCMYGAYTYGKDSMDTGTAYFDLEKSAAQTSDGYSRCQDQLRTYC
ncbi:hypothetical protein E8E13_005228 [Curvularia kusanoi]|uniref:MARVEL domain-containing protein n=1 Tax=Curvularia kusanoi TaxID=90978 RepID=A0A9P4TKR2_CURKU|nr:hypothetical protein E8E13_005228 [Curvularia kusanoi]